ncbi:MAG TPA: hypothetical protein VG055_04365 [Planctomycetaceae bacterium]|jgi:hypothetical protein|nr:hypothetical protein [Planctomycetaceae bacterium]
MSDEPKKRKWAWIGWALIAVILLAYVLSIGPAERYAATSADPKKAGAIIRSIYAPIF